jgi:hypothetical protein
MNALFCLFILVSKYAVHDMCMYNSAEMYKEKRKQYSSIYIVLQRSKILYCIVKHSIISLCVYL